MTKNKNFTSVEVGANKQWPQYMLNKNTVARKGMVTLSRPTSKGMPIARTALVIDMNKVAELQAECEIRIMEFEAGRDSFQCARSETFAFRRIASARLTLL